MGKYIQRIAYQYDTSELVKEFGIPLSYIFEMFESLVALKKIEGNGVTKILIAFTTDKSKNMEYSNMIEVLQIRCYIDVDTIRTMTMEEKKRLVLDCILKCMKYIADTKNWKAILFIDIYQEILEKGIKNEGQIGRTAVSPNKKHKAYIRYKYESNIEVFLIFDNDDKGVKFAVFPPSFSAFKQAVYKIEWVNDNTLRVCHSNKKDYWLYYVTENQFEFFFDRAERGDAHGQYDLGAMYFEGKSGLFTDKEKAIFWFKKSAEQGYTRAINILNKIERNSIQVISNKENDI